MGHYLGSEAIDHLLKLASFLLQIALVRYDGILHLSQHGAALITSTIFFLEESLLYLCLNASDFLKLDSLKITLWLKILSFYSTNLLMMSKLLELFFFGMLKTFLLLKISS